MPKFSVNLMTVASCFVEVEADSREEAIDRVYEENLPYANAFDGYDLGEWTLPSDLFPEYNKPEWDVEEVDAQ